MTKIEPLTSTAQTAGAGYVVTPCRRRRPGKHSEPHRCVLSGERLPAGDVQGLASPETVGQSEHDGLGDVFSRADAAGGVAGADVREVVSFALLAEGIPGAG